MGNFISKEDILVEIAVLFKQMDNGKLTIEELEKLVKYSGDLHERTLILRYKAFEEKIFGVRPIVEEIPEEIIEIPEVTTVIIEEESPIMEEIQEEIVNEIIENEPIEEAPLFQMDVKNEPSFGFSLFGDHLEDTKEESNLQENIVSPEEINPTITEIYEEKVELMSNFTEEIEPVIEKVNPIETTIEESTSDRTISEVERAHAENLARYFNKQDENIITDNIVSEPVAPSPSAPSFQKVESFFSPSIEPIKEIQPEPEISEHVFQEEKIESVKIIEEVFIPEPIQNLVSEAVLENTVDEATSFNHSDLAVFIHKYNLVDSSLASQFGVTKIASLIGSFGLNERLQFINELFDGSSENFSNAIKNLDILNSSEQARTKVAELAVTNDWDVESETVTEFIQKIIRRYA